MATAKKQVAAKKTRAKNVKKAAKKVAGKPAKKPASEKLAPKPVRVTKVPRKKTAKKASAKRPGLGRTVNMGPLRGDNSFPPSNKPMPNRTSRAPVTKAHGSPANDSTRGPGGQGLQAKKQSAKGGSKDD